MVCSLDRQWRETGRHLDSNPRQFLPRQYPDASLCFFLLRVQINLNGNPFLMSRDCLPHFPTLILSLKQELHAHSLLALHQIIK